MLQVAEMLLVLSLLAEGVSSVLEIVSFVVIGYHSQLYNKVGP